VVGWENWRKARQTRFWVRELGSVPQNNLNLEALSSGKDLFAQPLTKTASKHVTGNHGYSIYNNLKFAFEAAMNIRFSHSNLFWGASLAPILPSFPLRQHVSDL
jgi:hypothetical protein